MSLISVDHARRTAELHEKAMLIVIAYDDQTGKTDITTWGRLPQQKQAAAATGEKLEEFLGLDLAACVTHEDFRTVAPAEAKATIDDLQRKAEELAEQREKWEREVQRLSILLAALKTEANDPTQSPVESLCKIQARIDEYFADP